MVATHYEIETDDETASCAGLFLRRRQEGWNGWGGAELARRTGLEVRSDVEQVWKERAVSEPQVCLGHEHGKRKCRVQARSGRAKLADTRSSVFRFVDEYKPGGVTKTVPP
jgi:hypothetical protein